MGDRDYRSVIKSAVESVGRELEYRYKKDDISKTNVLDLDNISYSFRDAI